MRFGGRSRAASTSCRRDGSVRLGAMARATGSGPTEIPMRQRIQRQAVAVSGAAAIVETATDPAPLRESQNGSAAGGRAGTRRHTRSKRRRREGCTEWHRQGERSSLSSKGRLGLPSALQALRFWVGRLVLASGVVESRAPVCAAPAHLGSEPGAQQRPAHPVLF